MEDRKYNSPILEALYQKCRETMIIVDKDQMPDVSNHPFFKKKSEDALAFLEEHGCPGYTKLKDRKK